MSTMTHEELVQWSVFRDEFMEMNNLRCKLLRCRCEAAIRGTPEERALKAEWEWAIGALRAQAHNHADREIAKIAGGAL